MSAAILDIVKQLILRVDVATTVIKPEDFSFEGFDPMDVIKSLYDKASAQNIGDEEFMVDICTIISIGLMRGTLSAKSIGRTSKEGQQRITKIKAIYGIAEKISKDSPKAITVPRVVNSFPYLASRVNAFHNLGRGFNGPLQSSSLHSAMQHVAFGSLIPLGLVNSALISDAYMCFAIDMNIVINRVDVRDDTITNIYKNQQTYFQAALGSPLYSRQERIENFNALGLTTEASYYAMVTCANMLMAALSYTDGYSYDYNGFAAEFGLILKPQRPPPGFSASTPVPQPQQSQAQAQAHIPIPASSPLYAFTSQGQAELSQLNSQQLHQANLQQTTIQQEASSGNPFLTQSRAPASQLPVLPTHRTVSSEDLLGGSNSSPQANMGSLRGALRGGRGSPRQTRSLRGGKAV